MKKILAALLALALLLGCAAVSAEDAAENAAEPLTAAELAAWAEELKARALAAEPAEAAEGEDTREMEDGFLFIYPFANLYADTAELTADSRITRVEVSDVDVYPRDISSYMTPWDVIAAFPNHNADLTGDAEGAVLYLLETDEGGFLYGVVHRDRQRIYAIEYAEYVPEGDGFRFASLNFGFADSLLDEAWTDGLGAGSAVSAKEAQTVKASLKELDAKDEYAAVKSSRNGTELEPFGEDDLFFSGIDFINLKPEDLPGSPEQTLFDNEDGTWLMILEEEAWEAVFQCDRNGASPVIMSLTIRNDLLEGPRAVRLGDAFHEDMQRFRFEGNDTDGVTEVLYGGENSVSRGVVTYAGDDGMTLRYTCEAKGRQVELLLRYTESKLSEIIIHIL